MEAEPLATVVLIDVATHARLLYGEEGARELLPPGASYREHDYRFELTLPSGARASMHRGATADDVAAYLERDRREAR